MGLRDKTKGANVQQGYAEVRWTTFLLLLPLAMALTVSPSVVTIGVGTSTVPLTLVNEEKTPIPLTVMKGGIPVSMMVLLNKTTITYTLSPYPSTTTVTEALTFTNEIGLNLTKKIVVIFTYPYSISVTPTTFKYGLVNTYTIGLTPSPQSPLTLEVNGRGASSTFTLVSPLSALTIKVMSNTFTMAEKTVTLREVIPNVVLVVTPSVVKGVIGSEKVIKTIIMNLESAPVTLTVSNGGSKVITLVKNTTLSETYSLAQAGSFTHTVYLLVDGKTLASYPYTVNALRPIEVNKVITVVPQATEIVNLTLTNNLGKVVTVTLVPINVSAAPVSNALTLPTSTTVIPIILIAKKVTELPLQILYDNTTTTATIGVEVLKLRPSTISIEGSWAYPLSATHTVTLTNTLPVAFVATGAINSTTLGKLLLVPNNNYITLLIPPSTRTRVFTVTLRSGNATLAIVPVRYAFYVPVSAGGKMAYVPGLPAKATITLYNNFTKPYPVTLVIRPHTISMNVPPARPLRP